MQLPSERVAAISVDALSAGLERSAVEAIVQVVGAPYSIDAIRDSLQNLLALPDIADAQVIRSDHPRGLHLTFVVSPQPRLRQVHLTGDVPVSKLAATALAFDRSRRPSYRGYGSGPKPSDSSRLSPIAGTHWRR